MTLSKVLLLLGSVVTLMVTLSIGIIAYWWFRESPVWLSSSSPNQTYTVDLTGDRGRGGFIINSVVKYRLYKNGALLVQDRVAHSGDWLDISFELAYPEHEWLAENALRFWRYPHRVEDDRADTLLISNDSTKAISHLRIRTRDMFFVFDIPPGSTLRLSFTNESSNDIWCEGEFEDGQHFEYGVGFLESKVKDPLGYCLVIRDDRVTIESTRERGYDYKGSWNNLNIPPSPWCKP